MRNKAVVKSLVQRAAALTRLPIQKRNDEVMMMIMMMIIVELKRERGDLKKKRLSMKEIENERIRKDYERLCISVFDYV